MLKKLAIKAYSKAIGTGVGGSIATILLWVINAQLSTPLPEDVKVALTGLIVAITSTVAAYFAPRNEYPDE